MLLLLPSGLGVRRGQAGSGGVGWGRASPGVLRTAAHRDGHIALWTPVSIRCMGLQLCVPAVLAPLSPLQRWGRRAPPTPSRSLPLALCLAGSTDVHRARGLRQGPGRGAQVADSSALLNGPVEGKHPPVGEKVRPGGVEELAMGTQRVWRGRRGHGPGSASRRGAPPVAARSPSRSRSSETQEPCRAERKLGHAIQSRYSGRTSPTWLHARRALGVRTPGTGCEVGSGARSPAGSWLSLPLAGWATLGASPHSAPPRPQPAWSAQSVLRACQRPPLCPVTPFSVWTLRLPSWQSSEGQVSMSPEPW